MGMNGTTSPDRIWLAFLASACCCVLLVGTADAARDTPRFEIRSAYAELEDAVYFLHARINYPLSKQALEALQSGVELNFQLRIEVNRVRRYIPDANVATLLQRYQLRFNALVNRYVVRNLNSGGQQSFASLDAALSFLGRVSDLPILDKALLDPDRKYILKLQAELDVRRLPAPIQLLAFWLDDWRLTSAWYTWPLQP
jgi:hypothetical protein